MIGPFTGSGGIKPNTCLGEWISEYVDGSLSPVEQLCAERHLVACQGCRAEVDLERRLRATLRAEPAMPEALLTMLMSVSQEIPIQRPGRGAVNRFGVPAVPPAPTPVPAAWAVEMTQVRVLAPQAPAQHRSALRAAAFASAAASVSLAAVWAFSMSPGAAARPGAPAAVIPTRPAPPSSAPAAPMTDQQTVLVGTRAQFASRGAQSTP